MARIHTTIDVRDATEVVAHVRSYGNGPRYHDVELRADGELVVTFYMDGAEAAAALAAQLNGAREAPPAGPALRVVPETLTDLPQQAAE